MEMNLMSSTKKNQKHSIVLRVGLILAVFFALALGSLHILDVLTLSYHDSLTVESGTSWPEAAEFLLDNEAREKEIVTYASEIHELQTNEPGSYNVQLAYRRKTFSVTILVRDTVAPEGSVRDLVLYNPETVTPEDFLVSFNDKSRVTVRFENEPDLTKPGSREVAVILEDAGGNTTRLASELTVVLDTEAPVIEGARNLETYVEDTIAYRSGITVLDDQDESPELKIDNSAVDLSTPGLYELTYTATDHAGNTSSQTVTVKVYPKKPNHVEPEIIYEKIDNLLAKFIREDMTTRQKVEAVYCWVQIHNQYANHSEKDDWLQAAYALLQTHRGDCYSFYALNKLMLQRLGIPTIDVEKVKNHPRDTRHYWLMVSIDGGETYYHMDNVWSMGLCLVTDKQLDAFSASYKNCFNRDRSLYPATPEEKLPSNPLPWNDPDIKRANP
jgi:hypothetical protein